MPVKFTSSVKGFKLPEKKLWERWIKEACAEEGFKKINTQTHIVSDEDLLQINLKHLQHDYYTDIITFDYSEKDLLAGELFISIDRVKENATIHNAPEDEELRRVIIHGHLHLAGHGDKTPAQQKKMREKENHYLALFHVERV